VISGEAGAVIKVLKVNARFSYLLLLVAFFLYTPSGGGSKQKNNYNFRNIYLKLWVCVA
jgi:hypothetical protein